MIDRVCCKGVKSLFERSHGAVRNKTDTAGTEDKHLKETMAFHAGPAGPLRPLLPIAVRLTIVLGVTGVLAAGWMYAGTQSRAAVHASPGALNVTRVTLERVEIVGRREAADV